MRRLQFSNRPVSSTDSKNNLQRFFTENIAPSNDTSRPLRDPTKFRSEATKNEIESLVSQQRVSNVLHTARQHLESALQRMVTTTRAPLSFTAVPPSLPLNQSAAYSNGLQASQNSIVSNVSSNVLIQSADGLFAPVTAWVPIAPPLPSSQQQVNVQPAVIVNSPTPAPQWLTIAPDSTRVTIDQMRREQIIEEISELVHQQLVSTTLESQFRTQLEERVMQQLQNSGHDANRTRDFIRNIQQTTAIERNDFSHLGIYTAPAAADNLDSASSYQASQNAQNHIQRQATASNTREIRALKSEISELKNMMKLSFQLQLDMQRSLKQEISALISNAVKQPQMRFESRINSTMPANEGKCIICTDGTVDTVLYKCGHMCVSKLISFKLYSV